MNQNERHQYASKLQIISALFLSCFLLFGCLSSDKANIAPERVESEIIIDTEELFALLISDYKLYYSQGVNISDLTYVVPKLSWYQSVFHRAVQFRVGNRTSETESGDCDDYVNLAKGVSTELNWGNKVGAIPVGYFGYVQESGRGHAIIIFIYEEGGQSHVGFYDPQLGGKFVTLTKKEMNQCVIWSF